MFRYMHKGAIQPKILVVDDDPVMLNIYARVFSGRAYVVTFANSVAAAATLIKANHYELLVTGVLSENGKNRTLRISQRP